MLIEWRPEASASLREILSFISERNLRAALNLGEEIERATSALPHHPYLYRLGKVAGTRELVVHPNNQTPYHRPTRKFLHQYQQMANLLRRSPTD